LGCFAQKKQRKISIATWYYHSATNFDHFFVTLSDLHTTIKRNNTDTEDKKMKNQRKPDNIQETLSLSGGQNQGKWRNEVIQKAFEKGLLLLGCGENSIRFSPALTVTSDEIDVCLSIFDQVIKEVAG
jgi:adenosylmethionine-8-amino-7-oxononanoate aminotransferase